MAKFIYLCPRCGKTNAHTADTKDPPILNCGDCLMKEVEIVKMQPYRTSHKASRQHRTAEHR